MVVSSLDLWGRWTSDYSHGSPAGFRAPFGLNHAPLDPKPLVPPLPVSSASPLTPTTLGPSGPAPPDIPDLEDIQFSQDELMSFTRNRFGSENEAASPTFACTSWSLCLP